MVVKHGHPSKVNAYQNMIIMYAVISKINM